MIVIVFGLPGSGKSYFAERLSESLHCYYISSDKVRKNEFKEKGYSFRVKKMVYLRMIEIGKEVVFQGENVVFDGTFYLENMRQMIYENFDKHTDIHFIEVFALEALIKERMEKKRKYSEADFTIYENIKRIFQPMKGAHLQLISTNDNLEEMIKKATEYIKLNKKNHDDRRY